ncbi:elongator complex protein 1-like [Diaphorina citri]|uniref:Elongator complex protein 1-like n=1 Tax=Diaphorina citri TaxID=121845 RepID=A0A3Q0JJB7_DIACI|nr:elongator complex protein 1-like [Diaphorina citri]
MLHRKSTESDIKPAITELHSELSDEIDTLERNFFAQLNRLEVVRSLPPPVVTGVRGSGDDELSDWGSDTASTMSTYLKQDLRFTSPLQLEWSSASQCSILHNSILHTYKWRWVVDAAQGVVSVIDGAEVLVTDFSQSFIPPPMCLERVQSPVTGQSVNRVLRFADSGDLLVVTAGGSVHRLNPQSETLTIMTTNSESRKMNVWNEVPAKSQKDPKEYVPYLNGLRSLQPYQMKAEIDKQFGSYVSAVRHFASSSDEAELEECLELIRKHKLWSQVLDVFPKSSSSYKKIVKEYAFQLELKGRWEEAAVMYERGEAVEEAVKCFVKAGAWRSALALAKTLNYGSEQMNTLYSELSRSLESKRDFTSLVTMLELRRDTSLTRDVIVRIVRDNQTLALDLSRQYEMEDLIGK